MPLTAKGEEILADFKERYGTEEGERVFYATLNTNPGMKAVAEPAKAIEDFRPPDRCDGVQEDVGGKLMASKKAPEDMYEDEAFVEWLKKTFKGKKDRSVAVSAQNVPNDYKYMIDGFVLAGYLEKFRSPWGVLYAPTPKLYQFKPMPEGIEEWSDNELGGVRDFFGNPYAQGATFGDRPAMGEDEDFRPKDALGSPGYRGPKENVMNKKVKRIVEALLGEAPKDWRSERFGVFKVAQDAAKWFARTAGKGKFAVVDAEHGMWKVVPWRSGSGISTQFVTDGSVVWTGKDVQESEGHPDHDPECACEICQNMSKTEAASKDDEVELTDAERFLNSVYETTTSGAIATYPKGFVAPDDDELDPEKTGIDVTPKIESILREAAAVESYHLSNLAHSISSDATNLESIIKKFEALDAPLAMKFESALERVRNDIDVVKQQLLRLRR